MNYSEMTDFEVDAAVAAIIHPGLKITNFAGEAVVWFGNLETRVVRYCNSWADAGPIIEKHMICLAADVFAEPQDGGKWVAQPAYGWDSERVRSDNPLRAAMIVCLMTQEKPDAA